MSAHAVRSNFFLPPPRPFMYEFYYTIHDRLETSPAVKAASPAARAASPAVRAASPAVRAASRTHSRVISSEDALQASDAVVDLKVPKV